MLVCLIFSFLSVQSARADQMKEFLMSCAYGTAAGALVGVATLAFTDDPGSHMNNIARGASLGLYAGIGMGLYLVYGVKSDNSYAQVPAQKFFIVPTVHEKLDGANLVVNLVSF